MRWMSPLLTAVVTVALGLGVVGCPPSEGGESSAKAKPAPAESPKPAPTPEPAATDIPVPADFADEAEQEITEENYQSELDRLESELDDEE